ncbi:PTS sugar transporter subunit IIC [Schleiferilactobacillus harbinensis]|jgi:PTS system cellobiose-specific IIC component|uniref:Permease IIC component n=1 Tax=Schleiferilactobacillus harbinensis TaxID=304207 RepID=A0A510TWK7_9LACO|nr:PTS sugar transporter subunit IIC [Schleiferilactobacillus harbinensis]MBO3090541.1 PTS sugar transporter subunit IIC [Schleiferilactobacillus harbinensis]MCI1687490.1 PTS sugar transporter subunit IIC [Schleiferilactobacillus harbinensis]MCI1784266.1 PTS sugar transporter subunit IIC [Schleiferilactobacillus harbinensis]MCI1850433.1 PTS sugar transporter subunit IIC [Schleiferilactobacillus harbinensis]MCT2908698.1 PTS sugar transporter subunit IIC [Schleiferilactobacillus harbinensis]
MNDFINDKIMPPMMKFVNTKAISALRDGMIFSIPFIIVGSVFLIIANFPYTPIADYLLKTGWSAWFNQAYNASFGIMALFAVLGIGYSWTKNEGFEPLSGGITAVVGFFLVMRPSTAIQNAAGKVVIKDPSYLTGFIDRTWLGGQGMIAAIIIGLVTGWAYSWFLHKDIRIKLPDQVPANVAASFTALIPAFAITVGWEIVYILFDQFGHTTMTQFIYKAIQTPLQGVTDSFGGAMVIALIIPFMWFFGVHGATIIGGIVGPLLQANSLDNAKILAAHKALTVQNGGHVVTQALLDQFGTVTGSGITIGLVIFMLVFAKSAQMKSLGALEIAPAIFNINEPILFGLPVVLNPLMFVPFFITPAISMGLTYWAIKLGLLPLFNGIYVPWTTPAIISGFLVGSSWKTAAWQALMLVLTFFIYLPFARTMDKQMYAEEQANLAQEEAAKKTASANN